MAKLFGLNIPQQFMTGFIAGVFAPVLLWIASFVEPIAQSLISSIQLAIGRAGVVTGTGIGTDLIKTLGGEFPMPEMLWAGLGGGVLFVIGTYIYNLKWSPNAVPGMKETPVTKVALVLLYASVLATLVLTAFAIPTIPALLVLVINSFVTAWFVVTVLGKQLNLV